MTQEQPDWTAERAAIRARMNVADRGRFTASHSNYPSWDDVRRLLDHSDENEREKAELRIVLTASVHALHSYKHRNASVGLADEIIERGERLLK